MYKLVFAIETYLANRQLCFVMSTPKRIKRIWTKYLELHISNICDIVRQGSDSIQKCLM